MKSLRLGVAEQHAFATAALALRYGERAEGQPPAPVTASQLIEARRAEDVGNSLWLSLNRTQENLQRGGQPGRTATGQRMHTRAVTSIDRTISLNRALWVLAEEMRKLKA
jgi:leucyl aminopeptidase (aminopeptidase T)